MWPNYPVTELVGTAFKLRQRMKNNTVMCSRSPQNLEFSHFTLLFGRGRQRNVPKLIPHVQSHCFPHQSLLFCDVGVAVAVVGSLSNDDGDGNGNENITRKYIFISFVLLRDYFNSLNFYKNGELSRNQIGRSGVQVKKENEKFTVVRSRSPQNLKCGHFTLLFRRGRQRNVPKCKTHVQSDCFCSLNLLFCGVVVAVAVVVA